MREPKCNDRFVCIALPAYKRHALFLVSQTVNFVCGLSEFGWQTVKSAVAFDFCLRGQYLKILILNSRRGEQHKLRLTSMEQAMERDIAEACARSIVMIIENAFTGRRLSAQHGKSIDYGFGATVGWAGAKDQGWELVRRESDLLAG